MWSDRLKEAGINLHVICTGAGAGLQQMLWEVPGSSAYLSGGTFPYDKDEQISLLGFEPESFCSEDAAIDLASVAYMKAFRFKGKKAVGLGLTASVSSERIHRGDHRLHLCIITDTKAVALHIVLPKGVGKKDRGLDGVVCDNVALKFLMETLELDHHGLMGDYYLDGKPLTTDHFTDVTDRVKERFLLRPFFGANGTREQDIPSGGGYALMSGSFNPPHQGHFGMAANFLQNYGEQVVFEVGVTPPHKTAPTAQELLQRAKMLQGHNTLFSKDMPLYVDKSSAYPKMTLLIGADALIRMFDPKWGVDRDALLETFKKNGSNFIVTGRAIDGEFVTAEEAIKRCLLSNVGGSLGTGVSHSMFEPLEGRWDVSSTELRNK